MELLSRTCSTERMNIERILARTFVVVGGLFWVLMLWGSQVGSGYRIGPFAYITDCGTIPPVARELLRNLDVLVIDALRYTPHPHHLNIPAALEVIADLKPKQAILTHLTHEVSCRDEDRLPADVVLAYDGLSFICS